MDTLPHTPPVMLDPETLEVVPAYDFSSTFCVGLTFRDAQSPRARGASIGVVSPRPDLDGSDPDVWGCPGWYWFEDREHRTLTFRCAPTDRDRLERLWELQQDEVARDHWLRRVSEYDPDDRADWIDPLFALGVALTPTGKRVSHAEVRFETKRLRNQLARVLRDLRDEDDAR
jgi:hypothetical protein